MELTLPSTRNRLIWLGTFTLLLTAYLLHRGLSVDLSRKFEVFDLRFLIGILSIFHAYILTLDYRAIDDRRLPSLVKRFLNFQSFLGHSIILISGSVLLKVLLESNEFRFDIITVIGSYFAGIVLLYLFFLLLLYFHRFNLIREITQDFAIFISSYIVIGSCLYDQWIGGKIMIDWYPFGTLFLNF